MKNTTANNLIQRNEKLQTLLSKAQTEVAIRKRQIRDLAPDKNKIEEECQKTFNCDISELEQKINDLMTVASDKMDKIDEKIKAVQESNEKVS